MGELLRLWDSLLFEFFWCNTRMFSEGAVERRFGVKSGFKRNLGNIPLQVGTGEKSFAFFDPVCIDKIAEVLAEGFVNNLGKVAGGDIQSL